MERPHEDDRADTALLCGRCFLPFNTTAHKPLAMPACVHTVCAKCVHEDWPTPAPDDHALRCGVCGKAGAGPPVVRLGVLAAVMRGEQDDDDDDGGGGGGGEKDEGCEAKECQACEHEHHQATHHCVQCDEVMCDTATKFHLRYKQGPHTIVALAPSPQPHTLPSTPSVCPVHDRPIGYVCAHDGALACALCVSSTHLGHPLHIPRDVVGDKVAELRALVEQAEGKAREFGAGVEGAKARRDEVFAAVCQAELQVHDYFNQLLAHRDVLLGKLDKAKKAISQQHVDLATTARALAHSARHARDVMEAHPLSSPLSVAAAVHQLRQLLHCCDESISQQPAVGSVIRLKCAGVGVDVVRAKCDVVILKAAELGEMAWNGDKSHPKRRGDIQGPAVSVADHSGWYFVAGNVVVPPHHPTVYQFTVRVCASNSDQSGIAFGVASNRLNLVATQSCGVPGLWNCHGNGSLYRDGTLGSSPFHAGAGSLVQVRIDGAAGVLSFLVDGKQLTTMQYACDHEVVPVVCLFYKGNKVELVDSGDVLG